MALELVIFDCDGVLVDSEIISAQVLVELASEAGAAFDAAYVREHFQGRSFPSVAQSIRDRFEVALPPDFEEHYRQRLLERFAVEMRPTIGIKDFLDRLRIPACVATSSSPQRAARSLSIAGLDRYFPKVFTASMVEHGKPAPDIFLLAASEMGVAPANCLVIEDSVPGLQAAWAAGMEVAFYVGASHWAGVDPTPVAGFDKLRPLRPFSSWTDLVAVYPALQEAPLAPEQYP